MSRVLVSAIVVAFLLVQLVVPAAALFGQRPARFGWQMYANFPRLPDAWLIDSNGVAEPVDLGELFAVQRAEIDYATVLRSGLCGVTDAAAIRIQRPGQAPEEVNCR